MSAHPQAAEAATPAVGGELKLPASFLQEELFDAFDPDRSDFGVAIVWRLLGPLDERALAAALTALAQRHEALRTTLRRGATGVEQVVHAEAPAPPEVVAFGSRRDRRRFERLLWRSSERPFDVVGGPLLRSTLYRLGAHDHVLLLDLHHAIVDGWSTRVLLRDFQLLYAAERGLPAPSLGREPLQFGDYATWERSLRVPALEAFWRERLARPVQPLRLPGQRRDAGARPFDTAPLALDPVPAATLRTLATVGRARERSIGAIVRAGLAAALAPYAGDELVIGVIHANRDRAELQTTVGLAVDFLPLHVDVEGEPSFAELLRRTAIAWREVYDHRMPSGAIHALAPDARGPLGGRPFDVTLNLTPHAEAPRYRIGSGDGELRISELVGRHMRAVHPQRECSALARLAVIVAIDARGGLRGWIAPNNDALPRATVAAVGRGFTEALRRASVDPFRPIAAARSAT